MSDFVLGVNYWPRESAMAMWDRFDPVAIARDFARIAGLGLDLVRIFLRWDVFQPAPDTIDPGAVAKLEDVVALAEDTGLRTMPTFFCGHMSGVNWLPSWALDTTTGVQRFRTITEHGESPHGIGDFYSDERLLAAQLLFVRAVGRSARARKDGRCSLGSRQRVFELARCRNAARTPARTGALTSCANSRVSRHNPSPAVSTAKTSRSTATCDRRRCARRGPSRRCTAIRCTAPSRAASTTRRSYRFLCELVAGLARKPVLFTEFGNPQCPLQGSALPLLGRRRDGFVRNRGSRAAARRCGALGALWWCWTDYAAALADTPPFDHALHTSCVSGSFVPTDRQNPSHTRPPRARANAGWSARRRCSHFRTKTSTTLLLPGSTNRRVPFERYVCASRGTALSSRALVITGASSGVGRALTARAVRAGYDVLAVARREALLVELAAELASASGQIATLTLELQTPNAPQTIVAAALARFGRIDVLVNNAGAVATGPISEQSDAVLSEQFTSCMRSTPLALLREALPALRADARSRLLRRIGGRARSGRRTRCISECKSSDPLGRAHRAQRTA